MLDQDIADLVAVVEAEQGITTTQLPLTPEQIAHRNLLALIKQDIKADAVAIRTEKRECRSLGNTDAAAVAQSNLSRHRGEIRARLLVYGTLRGRSWERMEPKHADKNGRLSYWIAQAWTQYQAGVPMPDALKEMQ